MPASPVAYTPEIVERICEGLASGMGLREVLAGEGMPAQSCVYRWLSKHEDFRKQYQDARLAQAYRWADELIEIADDGRNDWMERNGKDGTPGWALNGDHVQRSRLRIDTRKFLLSKLLPKEYGDRVQAEISGPNGGPIEIKDETTLARWIALKLTAGATSGDKS